MNTMQLIKTLGLAIFFLSASSSQAAIVTFDSPAGNAVADQYSGPSWAFSDNGLTFTNLAAGSFTGIASNISQNSNGTNNLVHGYSGNGFLEITKTGGGLFNLVSLDLVISWYSSQANALININSNAHNISTSLATLNLNLNNVSAVYISGLTDGYWSMDNVVYTSVVPLPGSIWLLGSALSALGLFSKRRQLR